MEGIAITSSECSCSLEINTDCFFADLASAHLNQLGQAQIFAPFDFPNLV